MGESYCFFIKKQYNITVSIGGEMNISGVKAVEDPIAFREVAKASLLGLIGQTNSARIKRGQASLMPAQYRDALLYALHRYASDARVLTLMVEGYPYSDKEIYYRRLIFDQLIQEVCE
jgi:hypothetical protein